MLNSRLFLIALAGIGASVLAACDTQEGDGAQGVAATGDATLDGLHDTTVAGNAMPEVVLTNPAGETLNLADTRGQPVLLNLWATWCAPCVVEMPLLDELAADLEGEVEVITVSEDLRGAEVVVPFFEEHTFRNLPQWMDAENELAFAFGGGAMLPLTILYDAQGRELWRVIGGYDWGTPEARAKIRDALEAAEAQADATPEAAPQAAPQAAPTP